MLGQKRVLATFVSIEWIQKFVDIFDKSFYMVSIISKL